MINIHVHGGHADIARYKQYTVDRITDKIRESWRPRERLRRRTLTTKEGGTSTKTERRATCSCYTDAATRKCMMKGE
jgi:hypothetical protein